MYPGTLECATLWINNGNIRQQFESVLYSDDTTMLIIVTAITGLLNIFTGWKKDMKSPERMPQGVLIVWKEITVKWCFKIMY